MPRNPARALSPADHAVQSVRHIDLMHHMYKDHVITLSYVKRDGSVSSSRGKVTEFSGLPGFDTGSVTIADEIKGARTVNLHRITKIDR